MAFAREIIKKILENVRFRVPNTEEKESYYTQIGNTLLRISNHCTRLFVWDDILEKNPTLFNQKNLKYNLVNYYKKSLQPTDNS